MFVQAVLLHSKGISNFDPQSDYLNSLGREDLDESWFYTWRKEDEWIPENSSIAGVFLGDSYHNFTFTGTRNSGSLGYVESIFLRLREGYSHTPFNRLFSPPKTVQQLRTKLMGVNFVYFNATDGAEAKPVYSSARGFSWELDEHKGIVELRCPEDAHPGQLLVKFFEIIQVVQPAGKHVYKV